MSVLKVENLKKSFRGGLFLKPVDALRDVSFRIEPGQITGFLGSNGAGKTTTLKALLRLIKPDSGTVEIFGTKDWTAEVRERVGFLPENPYFYEYLTGQEFLQFYGRLGAALKASEIGERIGTLLKMVDLEHARHRALRTYSKGMLQRIGLAQALIHRPELVILDEPMTGLDPDGRMQISSIIRDVARAGAAVFFSSHLLHDAETMCDRLVILREGLVAYEGGTLKLLESLQAGYRLVYAKEGKTVEEHLPAVHDLQSRIDRLRGTGHDILEVAFRKPSLEEAFLKIGSRHPVGEARP